MDSEDSKILDELADNKRRSLTDAERKLVQAIEEVRQLHVATPPDEPQELSDEDIEKLADSWGDQRIIRPAFLTWLFTHRNARLWIRNRKIRIPNCLISRSKNNTVWDSIYGLDISDCELPFSLEFDHCVFPSWLKFNQAKVTGLSFKACWMYDLTGRDIVVNGDIKIKNCRTKIMIDLSYSQILGDLQYAHCQSPGIHCDGITIAKNLELKDLNLTSTFGGNIHVRDANVKGDANLYDIDGVGMIHFDTTTIGGDLELQRITFDDGFSNGFWAPQLEVGKGFSWSGCVINKDTKLWIPNGRAYRFGGDNPLTVGTRTLNLDGFEYDVAVSFSMVVNTYEEWLKNHYVWRRQPYEVYARYLRGTYPSKANKFLVRAEDERRRRLKYSRVWSVILCITTGYGYLPLRSLGWITLFVLIGTGIFQWAYATGALTQTGKEVPTTFNSLIYSLDLFLPIINFHQAEYWIPTGVPLNGLLAQFYMWIHIALGWILATLAVAGFTGFLKGKGD